MRGTDQKLELQKRRAVKKKKKKKKKKVVGTPRHLVSNAGGLKHKKKKKTPTRPARNKLPSWGKRDAKKKFGRGKRRLGKGG